MKTTLELPDELFRAVKLRAVVQGRTVKDLVSELLSQGMGLSSPTQLAPGVLSERVRIQENGLPMVVCRSDATATGMTLDALLKLEQDALHEEDLTRAGTTL